MPLFLYLLCLFSFFQVTLLNSASSKQILDPYEKITATKALACYKRYEPELKGKSQVELNRLLMHCFAEPADKRPECRERAVALLFGGAQAEGRIMDTPLRDAVLYDDLPLAHYVCTNHPEDPNKMATSAPLWFYAKSVAMAQLLHKHGAYILAKDIYLHGTILHRICYGDGLPPELIEFYCSQHPPLINEPMPSGMTPLTICIEQLICLRPSLFLRSYPYILVNLGADSSIAPTGGYYASKTPSDMLKEYMQKRELTPAWKQEIEDLITYIEHPPKRSSLFEKLWNQWHDKLD